VLTLFSYPGLFGLADNNPYGLKIFAFLRLCGLAFRHEHVLDAGAAPRGQLPYVLDDDRTIGDSDAIIAHLIASRGLGIDRDRTPAQRDTDLMVRRVLDDLYWVMSYSRWKDPRFSPLFIDAFLAHHAGVTREALEAARQYNFQRYHYQGIGRYAPEAAYERGIADIEVLGNLLPAQGFLFGATPTSADAGLYGFLANISFYPIETPLKAALLRRPHLVAHCRSVHALVTA